MKKFKTLRNKKGFTLIELLTVIAILGILVLLAAPKFLGYTEKANVVKIQSELKAIETAVDLNSIDNPEFSKHWVTLDSDEVQELNDSGKLIDKNGNIKDDLEGGIYVKLEDLDSVKVHGSTGDFVIDDKTGGVYYFNENFSLNPNKPSPSTDEIPTYKGTDPKAGLTVNADGSVTMEDGTTIPVANDSHFQWVSSSLGYDDPINGKGYYKYIGSQKMIVIPEQIYGVKRTNYANMFANSDVTKVVNLNKNVTSMYGMFDSSTAANLDLSHFDTSNVTDMSFMFANSKAQSINMSSFDTSKVKTMQSMFRFISASTLDLSHFDTSNVTSMFWMFRDSSSLTSLDISSFDISSLATDKIEQMFRNLTVTEVYVKDVNAANFFNTSTEKPATLTFTVKP